MCVFFFFIMIFFFFFPRLLLFSCVLSQRALTLIDCSVEALQRRLCSHMPQDVLHSLFLTKGDLPHLSSSSSHDDKRDLKEERNTDKSAPLLGSPWLSPAQYLALSLGLARAAYRDSLEVSKNCIRRKFLCSLFSATQSWCMYSRLPVG